MAWHKLEQVVCRSEAVPDERPLNFRWRGRWVAVELIRRQWLESEASGAAPTYKVFEIDCRLGPCRLRVPQQGWVWELWLP